MKMIMLLIIMMSLISIVSAVTIDCDSCEDCNDKIQNASIGDTVRLTVDILNYDGTCINFDGKDSVIFDGGGHTIDGIDSYSYYGIYLPTYSNNNTVMNCTLTDFRYGIYGFAAIDTTIENIISTSNRDAGIAILYSGGLTIKDSYLYDNNYKDFHFRPDLVSDCDAILLNTTGSGGYPIGFYNDTVDINDVVYAGLYLCTAHNSVLNNVTIGHSNNVWNSNGFTIYDSNGVILSNITSVDNGYGIELYNSNDCVIQDSNFSGSHHYNVYLSYSSGNTLKNIESNSSDQAGLYIFHSTGNIISDSRFCDDPFGIRIDTSSFTVVNNSHFENNFINGLSTYVSSDCLIYNNYFNNSVDVAVDHYFNEWNITQAPGPNIIGGPSIGGNYWHCYDGVDEDSDGFGDASVVLDDMNLNADHLPLMYVDIVLPICGDVDGNGYVSSNDVVETYRRAVDPNYPVYSGWAADVDGNGYISSNDVVNIYQKAVNPDYQLDCIIQ